MLLILKNCFVKFLNSEKCLGRGFLTSVRPWWVRYKVLCSKQVVPAMGTGGSYPSIPIEYFRVIDFQLHERHNQSRILDPSSWSRLQLPKSWSTFYDAFLALRFVFVPFAFIPGIRLQFLEKGRPQGVQRTYLPACICITISSKRALILIVLLVETGVGEQTDTTATQLHGGREGNAPCLPWLWCYRLLYNYVFEIFESGFSNAAHPTYLCFPALVNRIVP